MKSQKRSIIRLFIFSLILLSGLCVPVLRRSAEAGISLNSEKIRTVSAFCGQGKELCESIVVRPIKNAVQAEKRMSGEFLFCGEIPLLCGINNLVVFAVSFVQNGFFYSKNKYLKFVVFLKTLL
ncbi:MAG: hypothetical protein IJL70_07670 [Treponema sp.]|nr:hypothetical protein [Treponema sp.]